MNPAALKANRKWLKSSATVILDGDSLTEEHLRKAGFKTLDPLAELNLEGYNVVVPDITTMTREALKELGLDNKTVVKCKNMFALGICFFLYNRPEDHAKKYLESKFAKKNPLIAEGQQAGHRRRIQLRSQYAPVRQHLYRSPREAAKGTYRSISGNVATAWGLLAASEKSGLPSSAAPTPSPPPR